MEFFPVIVPFIVFVLAVAELANGPRGKIPTVFAGAVFSAEARVYLPASVNDFLEAGKSSSK